MEGLVLHNALGGITLKDEDNERVWVQAGGGVPWHSLVLWCIEHGYGGIENLSLIPGTVGAAPIQNIGAYGVELKDCFYELEAVELTTGVLRKFNAQDCAFGYRDSIFKQALKGQFLISSLCLQLSKNPNYNTSYGAIKEIIGNKVLNLQNLSKAVIAIRRSKLPDPQLIGNAGSFFKNPIIPRSQYEELCQRYPNLPSYPTEQPEALKIPAGWLIEQAGWKGKRQGNAGVHHQQALVLVNYGQAKGTEILTLAQDIKADIWERFGVEITPEVNIW